MKSLSSASRSCLLSPRTLPCSLLPLLNASSKMTVVRLPAWSTVVVGSVATALVQSDANSRLLSILKKTFVLLLVLNWRALPFVWHIGELVPPGSSRPSEADVDDPAPPLPCRQSSGDSSRSSTSRSGRKGRRERWRSEEIRSKLRRSRKAGSAGLRRITTGSEFYLLFRLYTEVSKQARTAQ